MLSQVNQFTKVITHYLAHCRLAKNAAYQKSPVRIVRGYFSKSDDGVLFSVCIPGFAGFPTFTAKALAEDTQRLRLFSERDQRRILACSYGFIRDYELIDSDVTYSITDKFRDIETREEMLKIRVKVANKKFTRVMKVSDIKTDEHLKYFSNRDAFAIGLVQGTEQTLNDIEEITALKAKNDDTSS